MRLVIEQSRGIGRQERQHVGTLFLLVALLGIQHGLTREMFQEIGRQPQKDAESLLRELRKSAGRAAVEPQPTENYDLVLSTARSLAKRDGSPLVLERHLLSALLATPSTALDNALGYLGTSRDALLAALRQLRYTAGTQAVWSEFPAQ